MELRPHVIYRPASPTTLGAPPFTPLELRRAYNFEPLYLRGINGSGTRIAIVDAFGDPTLSSDLARFDAMTGLPNPTVNFFFPDGQPKRTSSSWAVETSLDVEWAHAIAPGATIDLVVAFDASLGSIFDGIAFVANSLPNETVLSMSFGLSESSYPTTGSFTIAATHQLFATITGHGTTPFASSGDSGATSCCNAQYPSSDPLVVAVGGTSLTLNSTAFYVAESAWSGSTAGSSIVYSKPAWQQGLGDSNRDTVDVSYDADPNTGVLVESGGKLFQVGGTSAGAPQWAALMALASQANSAKYGAAQPLLYKISSYHDITIGSDGFFAATKGWDYPTGLGSPNANSTISAAAAGDFNLIASTTSLSLQAGSPGTSSITLNSIGVFSGNVTLTASVSSPLLSVSLSPTVISLSLGKSGMSTLKVTAAAVGDYTITLTGSSGALSHSLSVTATVSSAAGGSGGGRIIAT